MCVSYFRQFCAKVKADYLCPLSRWGTVCLAGTVAASDPSQTNQTEKLGTKPPRASFLLRFDKSSLWTLQESALYCGLDSLQERMLQRDRLA